MQKSKSERYEPRRDLRSSTKVNSHFKWKNERSVIGALEVESEPSLDLKAKMNVHEVIGYEDDLKTCLKTWKKLKLKDEFIKAFESIPPKTICCGLVTQQDETIRSTTALLNEGWVKSTNENILKEECFKISIFVWNWTNVSGKSETVIPMIRFHSLEKNSINKSSA